MKRKSRKPVQKKRKSGAGQPADPGKRVSLKMLRNVALGVVVLGGAGAFGVRKVMADLSEQDLSKIGNGKPTIVQIHDPQCPMCQALQKETRAALENFEECTIQYLVANIKTEEGGALAAQLGVPHVTLVFYDKDGEVQEILRGEQSRDILLSRFEDILSVRRAS